MIDQATNWIVTCEHGGNAIPILHQPLFQSRRATAMLRSHRGYDPGAWEASLQVASNLPCSETHPPGYEKRFHRDALVDEPGRGQGFATWQTSGVTWAASRVSRLLVDLNRSPGSVDLFSMFSNQESPEGRERLMEVWHRPYRDFVHQRIADQLSSVGWIIHLSVHTFTPRLKKRWRPIDVGLLFDPQRPREVELCDAWQQAIRDASPRFRVAANAPYAGTDDGLTTWLRTRFNSNAYVGIEIEINNRYFKRSPQAQRDVVDLVVHGLKVAASHTSG